MVLYAGTSGYAYKQWKGRLYPENLPDNRMLHDYAQRFTTVEINNTFYRIPKAAVVEAWAAAVPAEFRFALKASRRITHVQRLTDVKDPLDYLFAVAGRLGPRLGPLLFQLPPFLKKDAPRLAAFLNLIPAGFRVALEFRHQSWLDDEVFALLRDHGVALCLAEAEQGLDIPRVATADWGYLRLRRPDYDDDELNQWLTYIGDQPWQDSFIFFKHEDEAKGPAMARRLMSLAGPATVQS